jgi:hypothetical protein
LCTKAPFLDDFTATLHLHTILVAQSEFLFRESSTSSYLLFRAFGYPNCQVSNMCKNSFDLVVTVRGGVQVTFFGDSFGRTVGSRELKLVSRVPGIAFLFDFAAAFCQFGDFWSLD